MTTLARLTLALIIPLGFCVGCGGDSTPQPSFEKAGPAPQSEPVPQAFAQGESSHPPGRSPVQDADPGQPGPGGRETDGGAAGPDLTAIQVALEEPPPIAVPQWKPAPELTELMESLEAQAPAAEEPSITGTWKGILCRYPHPVALALELEPGEAPPQPPAFGGSGFGRPTQPQQSPRTRDFGGAGFDRQPQPFGGLRNRPRGFGGPAADDLHAQHPADPEQPRDVMGLQGRLQQTVLYDGARRGLGAVQDGEAAVAGSFDAPLGTFSVQPQPDGRRPGRPANGDAGFSGVYVPATGDAPEVLVGTWGRNQYGTDFIVLTRPDAAEKMLWQPVREATTYLARGASQYIRQDPKRLRPFKKLGRFDQAGPDNPFYNAFLVWADRLHDEYPEMDLWRTDAGIITSRALNLLEDQYFSEHFGTDYFDLKEAESAWLFYPIATDRSTDQSWGQKMRGYTHLGRSFNPTGTGGRIDNVPRLLAMRELRRYHAHLLERLETAEPAPRVLEDFAALEPRALEQVKPLWPSEQQALAEAFEAARRRLAGPALALAAARAVREAEGLDGAKQLANWEAQHAATLALVEPAERERIHQWVLGRLDVLAAELAEAHVPRVKSFADDLEGLESMGTWYQQIVRDHAPLMRTKPFEALFEHVRVERERRLARLAPQIGRQIAAASDAAAVDGVLERYLAVGADHNTAAGRALRDAARQRKEQLDLEAVRALYSEREWRWRQSGRVGAVDEGPTEEEIRLALLRTIKDIGGKMVDAHTAHFHHLIIPGVYMRVHIKEVRLLSDPKPFDDGSGRYHCTWQASGTAKWPDEFLDNFGGRGQTALFELQEEIINAAINSPRASITDILIPTPGGWTSPTMAGRGIDGMFGKSR